MKSTKRVFLTFVTILICAVLICIDGNVEAREEVKKYTLYNTMPKTLAGNIKTNNYVYLSDLPWKFSESSWKDTRALRVNQNESGGLISVLVDGKKTYFLNGVFAHATSTVIYDISEYTSKGYDTFSAYLGVDTAVGSNGNGVKFTIYASTDGVEWISLKTTGILKGNTDSEKVILAVNGYKYLKLYANNNGNQDSDHSVYADAMIYDSANYIPKVDTEVSYIKTLVEYDDELVKHSNQEIVNNEDLELMLLQRTLVKKIGYSILQAYATSSEENSETIKWLFTNKNILKKYITGGEPLGNYVSSLNILTKLYNTYKSDLESGDDTFLTMMLAISLTHSSNVSFWVSGAGGERVYSDPVNRYAVLKKLYTKTGLPNNYQPIFETEIFKSLTVEEMRWVVDNQLSDEEIPWLNWYSSRIQNPNDSTKYDGRNSDHTPKNPYTYIQYYQGWEYYDTGYYKENSNYCGVNYLNKNENGYARGLNCDDEYHLTEWGVGTNTTSKPRLWIVWEEDGVCGSISKTGANLEAVYGNPTCVIGQPGHAAYLVPTKTKNQDGTFTTFWSIGNDVSGWAESEKGERFPLNWGSKSNGWHSYYNVSYVLLGQAGLNDFENYEKALEYKFIADINEFDNNKQREIYREVVGTQAISDTNTKNTNAIENFNLDAWYGLIQTFLKDKDMTSTDYYELSKEIMANMKEYPLAMYDLLKLIENKITDTEAYLYDRDIKEVLKELSEVSDNSTYLQGKAIKQVANRLRGQQSKSLITFSFDGEDANNIVLESVQPFEYSLNYSYDPNTGEVKGDWTQVTGRRKEDLTKRLSEINSTHDIVIHLLATPDRTPSNVTVLDIKDGTATTNLYGNDLENKVIGTTDVMEWQIEGTSTWTKFKDELPDLTGTTRVLVRNAAHEMTLAGPAVGFLFAADPEADPTKVYVPIKRLSAKASSRQNNNEHESKAIDGNANTYWHNRWDGQDKDRWIEIEVTDGPIELSKIDYMPRQDTGTNGRFTKTKIEVSLDEKNWTTIEEGVIWANDSSTKTYILKTPVKAKYVRLTALESVGSFASAAMINLYENTVSDTIPVEDLSVSYMMNGFVYNGEEKTPIVTVKYEDKELINGEDYTIEYKNNINAGTAKIILAGLGIYDGRKEFEFTINKALQPDVMPPSEMMATTNQDTLASLTGLPEGWSWKNPDTPLKAGKTINAVAIYKDQANYEIYEATVAITQDVGERPQISGPTEKQIFDITKDEPKTLEYFKGLITIYDKEDANDGIPLKITYDTDWDGSWTNVGTYHLYVTAEDSDGNITEYILEFYLVTDTEVNIQNFTIEIDDVENIYYTGKEITPNFKVIDNNGHELTLGVDYTLEFCNNTNAGPATIKITGIGIYSGEINKNFTIKKAKEPEVLPAPTITVPKDVKSLSDINLPDGWRWADENLELKDGENTITIIYVGDANHDSLEMTITIIKEKTLVENPDDNKNNDNQNKKPTDNNQNSGNGNSANTNTTTPVSTKKKYYKAKNNKEYKTSGKGGNANPDDIIDYDEYYEEPEKTSDKDLNSKTKKYNSNKTTKEKNQSKNSEDNYYKTIIIIGSGAVVTFTLAYPFFFKRRKKNDHKN